MPDVDVREPGRCFEEVPSPAQDFFLKGAGSLDWGMKHRLSRVFDPRTGRTVMLAVDHGYFQGPTTGLERVDLNIVPLLPHADAYPWDPIFPRQRHVQWCCALAAGRAS